jgi:hypothetical protein
MLFIDILFKIQKKNKIYYAIKKFIKFNLILTLLFLFLIENIYIFINKIF